jgi:ribonuclease Z
LPVRFPVAPIGKILAQYRRILLFGEPGVGKSTLAADLGRAFRVAGRLCSCIGADPGSPAFGVPGAVCRGEWSENGWRLVDFEALCTLDAGRFRLPLLLAVRRLAGRCPAGELLIDGPGVVWGVAGAELLTGLAQMVRADVVVALVRSGEPPPLERELESMPEQIIRVDAVSGARQRSKRARARHRTKLWDSFLADAREHLVELGGRPLIGVPPPVEASEAWQGRQIALLGERGATLALGEVLDRDGDRLRMRMPFLPHATPRAILARDARRAPDGLLSTAKLPPSAVIHYVPPPDMTPFSGIGAPSGPRPVVRVGPATVTLVNGVFGDPVLHLRLRQRRRSILFDLGEAGRLPARIAHQVSHAFISHAHFDHIAGFLWLLRSRIGDLPACRLFGPPGLIGNIKGLVGGIRWDRIGERGPRFEVCEVRGDRLVRARVQAGHAAIELLEERVVTDGVLVTERELSVRAVTLDHGTPVLAFAFEPLPQINVRKERLAARGLAPGAWLNELKGNLARGERGTRVLLPDGSAEWSGDLGDELVTMRPAEKLVYATDFADSPANRERLRSLAEGAHTLFCEAAFVEADIQQARDTGHLTARSCGEIASGAGVARLIPFHFSRRYEHEPQRIYAEVRAACPRTIVPCWLAGTSA